MMKLSIILVSYNTQQLTENCLSSLIEYIDLNNVEIIVVDNASSDDSVKMIREKFSFVKLIENESNLGFAKANNIGVHQSSGEHILLLNTDTIIIEDFFSPILGYLEDAKDVGVLGCCVLNHDRTLQYTCFNAPNLFTGLSFFNLDIIKKIFNPFTYWKDMKYWDHSSVRDVACVSGCFMWIRRDVVNVFHGLDENIFMYYEDTEFCMRIRKNSDYRVVYFPETCIVHLGGASGDLKESNPEIMKYCYHSFNYYLEVTYGTAYQKLFRFICRLVWCVELSGLFLLRNFKLFEKKYRLINWMLSE